MTTFSAQVAAGTADSHESTAGVISRGDTIVNLGQADTYGAFYFPGVTIPQGAAINAASLAVVIGSADYDSPNVNIHLEDSDNAGTLGTADYDISTRTRTTAYGTWSGTNIGAGATNTADFAAAVQEVVDRAGWASGNAMVVIWHGQTGTSIRVDSYDGSAANAATLNIEYSGGLPIKALYYAGLRSEL